MPLSIPEAEMLEGKNESHGRAKNILKSYQVGTGSEERANYKAFIKILQCRK